MPSYDYELPDELTPEQENVLNLITELQSQREFIIVQGVAGSGKTTIALHALKNIVEDREINEIKMNLRNKEITPILITYNKNLVDFCRQILEQFDTVAPYLAEQGDIQPGKINILSFHQLCMMMVDDGTKSKLLSDRKCIDIVADIAAKRGITDILPSHIYAIITAFFKGNKTSKNSNEKSEVASRIRKFIIKQYKKKVKYDRADLSLEILKSLEENEKRLDMIKEISARELRTYTRIKLGDNKPEYADMINWLKLFFEDLREFSDTENEVNEYIETLNERSIHHDLWNKIKDRVIELSKKFGLRGTNIFQSLRHRLVNPLIIVDETQDLSQVECNIIISLWFQLQKKDNKGNRLIFLGDLNQQMMPTGFRWEQLIDLINKQAQRYKYSKERFDPGKGFVDAEENKTAPFLILGNNYRTSWEIAEFVYNMMKKIANQNLSGKDLKYCMENLIHHDKTLPSQIEDKLYEIKKEDRIPRIVIVEQDSFINGLKKYIATLNKKKTDKNKRLVIITAHDDDITQLIEKNPDMLQGFTYYPILNCKGLEFMSCAIFGLPIKSDDSGSLESDILAQWYTVCTRARLQETIFLDREQFNYIKNAGWQTILNDNDIVSIIDPERDNIASIIAPENLIDSENLDKTSSDEEIVVKHFLEKVGESSLNPEALKASGENFWVKFKEKVNETFLLEAISNYERGGWEEEADNARKEAPKIFENHEYYEQAINWYDKIGDSLGVIRCAKLQIDQLKRKNKDDTISDIKRLNELALKKIELFELQKDFSSLAKAYEIREEFSKAAEYAIKAKELGNAERNANRIIESDEKFKWFEEIILCYIKLKPDEIISSNKLTNEDRLKKAEELTEKLPCKRKSYAAKIAKEYERDGDLLPNAYRVFCDFEDKKGAGLLAHRWEIERKYGILVKAYKMIDDTEQINLLGNRLKKKKEFESAAYCFKSLKNFSEAARCLMEAKKYWEKQLKKKQLEDIKDFITNLRERLQVYDEKYNLKEDSSIDEIKKVIEKWFKDKAENILDRYIKDGKDVEAVKGWYKICDNKKKAEKHIDKLWKKDKEHIKLKAIECWRSIGKIEKARRKIDELLKENNDKNKTDGLSNLVKNALFAYKAYDILYKDKKSYRDSAKNNLKKKLEENKSEDAKKILADILWDTHLEKDRLKAVSLWHELGDEENVRKKIDKLFPQSPLFIYKAYCELYKYNNEVWSSAIDELFEELKKDDSNQSIEDILEVLWKSGKKNQQLKAIKWWLKLDRYNEAHKKIDELSLHDDISSDAANIIYDATNRELYKDNIEAWDSVIDKLFEKLKKDASNKSIENILKKLWESDEEYKQLKAIKWWLKLDKHNKAEEKIDNLKLDSLKNIMLIYKAYHILYNDDDLVKAKEELKVKLQEDGSHNAKEALANILWDSDSEEDKLEAVKLWNELDNEKNARKKIDKLPIPQNASFVSKAYKTLYKNNSSELHNAQEQLKQKIKQDVSDSTDKKITESSDSAEPSESIVTSTTLIQAIDTLKDTINGITFKNHKKNKIIEDLKYIISEVENNEFQDGKEQWNITRKIILKSCENDVIEKQINTLDDYWKKMLDKKIL